MESNWRWFRELYAPGGYIGPLWFADPRITFLGKLITPIVVPPWTCTHIAVFTDAPPFYWQYWLGIITPVGVYGQFEWKYSNAIRPIGAKWWHLFPVEPDSP